MRKIIIVSIFLLVIAGQQVRADSVNCTVEFSSSSLISHQSGTPMTVTVINNSDVSLGWIRIGKSIDDMAIHANASDEWTISGDAQFLEFTGGPLGFGQRVSLPLTVDIVGNYDARGSWYVEAGTESGAEDIRNCNGETSITIVSQDLDIVPPTIFQLEVTINSDSQVTMEWKTNEPTNSKVEYGPTSGVKALRKEYEKDPNVYTYTKLDQTLTMVHSLTLTEGVTFGQTYYYQVSSTDASGNQTIVGEFTFVTGAGESITHTVTVTNSVTQTTTNTNSNTIVRMIVDSTPPKVTLTNTWEKFYAKGPTVTGTASDNKLVVAVDYSIDKGKTWRPVEIESRKARVNFEIDLPIEEEGNYDFQVRAYDAEGNKGVSKTQTIVIDRLPPLFGAAYLSWGSGLSVPITNEYVTTMVGIPLSLTLGAVGGPIGVTIGGLEAPYTLFRDETSGLWTGRLIFLNPGKRTIAATGIDGFGRTTTSDLFQVDVLPAGTVRNDAGEPLSAEISVMVQDPITGVFSLWDGAPFGWDNPIKTNTAGAFGLVLPQGTYYLEVNALNYVLNTSTIFTLTGTSLVRAQVVLLHQPMVTIGNWKLPLPVFWQHPFTAELAASSNTTSQGTETQKQKWNQPLPRMELILETGDRVSPTDWLGQPTVLLLDSPWLPSIAQSVESLNQLATSFPKLRTVWAASQQGMFVLQGIRARMGGIGSILVADDTAALTEYVGVHQLPLGIVIDRMGMVRGVYRGIVPFEVVKQVMEE